MPPLTGIVKLYGNEISWAAKVATQEINEKGGVLGKQLELIIKDDGSLPDTAIVAAQSLVDNYNCSAIIGNLLSNSRIAVANMVAEVKKIPYLNFSFYEGSISSRYFFSFSALPNQQIEKMIPCVVKNYGPKVFFAGNNYEWPRGSIHAAKLALLQQGGEVVGEEYFPIGCEIEDLKKLVNQVSVSGADIFIPYFAGLDQIHLLTIFAQKGLKKRMKVVMGHYDEAMVSLLPPEVREGFFSTNTYFMSLNTSKNKEYLNRLTKQDGVNGIWPEGNGILTNFGEGTYVCMHAFANAANEAGTIETEKLIDALENVTVDAPQGRVVMDKISHHAAVNTYLTRCNLDGTFSILEEFGQIRPITPQRYKNKELVQEASLRKPSEVYKKLNFISNNILEAIDIAVVSTNEDGIIQQLNLGAIEMFGYPKDEIVGQSVNLLLPPHLRNHHQQLMKQFIESEKIEIRMGKRGEITGYKKDGTFFPAEATLKKFKSEDGWITVVTLIDITERKQAEEELNWRANHDPLTELPNRVLIKERITNALQRTKNTGKNIALLFIDLDNFKLVNDTYGHSVGDKLLLNIAKILNEQVRPGDTIARLGGDEFVILCENIDDQSELYSLCDRINDSLRKPFLLDNKEVFSTASIGISIGHGSMHSAEDLLRESDMAMYMSKKQGRDTWRLYSSDLQVNSKQTLEIVAGLRNAIDKNELSLVYQPIVSASGSIQGIEALLRWESTSGFISPGIFVPIAETTGAIVPIGKWVFREACKMQNKLQSVYGKVSPYISVNISTRQLNEIDIVDEFKSILVEESANPKKILLEVTETSLMSDVQTNLRMLNGLHQLGMKIAVDDFGTGYSSLSQLLRLPISVIKIDREFIDGLDKRKESKLITAAIIQIAKKLGKGVIAEGVENEAQLFEIRVLGVNHIQGYYFYRPLSENKLMEALDNQKEIFQSTLYNLYHYIYISKAVDEMNKEKINFLLEQARNFNSNNGITGYLIHSGGYFLQLLEGRKMVIDNLVEKISKDKRHRDMTKILGGYTNKRLFDTWSMGFWNLETTANEINNWKNITIAGFAKDAPTCYAFFKALAKSLDE